MNTINKSIKYLSLLFIVVGLVISSGALQVPLIPEGTDKPLPHQQDNNLWDRLRADFNLDHATAQKRVQTHRAWFLNNPDYIEKVLSRAEPYLYYIAEEIKARDLPMEFILIPVVESMYNPNARSKAGALGLWQLMSVTAKHYKIVQNSMYDGRRSIQESTNAALNHLAYLATVYNNDWHLVLAAYNVGHGRINRELAKNKAAGLPTDFWSLKNLPKETLDYVPKIMALAEVVKNYKRHDIDIPSVADEPQVAVVDIDVEDYLDLTIAADLADVEPETLKEMNPGFNQTIIANNTDSLLIPYEKLEIFEAALENYEPTKKVTYNYVVQAGDTLNQISKTHNTSVAMIQQYNNLSTNNLKIGQKLKIPTGA
ncbi:MAG: transglycosylase SLT domain-containing protein [Gammaproteobacteria bacterium]|jgi:membrane-bound lytic murein transglycosylase D